MPNPPAGYCEIEHTADWELHVWAPDLAGLLEQAARGMFQLAGIQLKTGARRQREIELNASDAESLLVAFLSELLFIVEEDQAGFDDYQIELDGYTLRAVLHSAPLAAQKKEIKAVTYHRIAVEHTKLGLEVNIVFDV